jgi:hypothetical protein
MERPALSDAGHALLRLLLRGRRGRVPLVVNVYGPFQTTLQPPQPTFFADKGAQWGIAYPLLGFACNHWIVPTPGSSDHGSWFAFQQGGALLRVFNLDATNPLMIPVLGSYYIANVTYVRPGPRWTAPPRICASA